MRLRLTLLQIAMLASTGCGGQTAASPGTPADGGKEASVGGEGGVDGGKDAGEFPEAACGGCNCGGGPNVPSGSATPDVACAIAQSVVGSDVAYGFACESFCDELNGGGGGYFCTLPQDYLAAFDGAQGDAGDAGGASDGGFVCPSWSGTVVVTCGIDCTGRRTEGVAEPEACGDAGVGSILAERAYLEAVSVHAFATLERELAAHGAPPALLRDVRRARRDEVRHTAMMTRLARRFEGRPRPFEAGPATPVRGLFAIALENAVEGCVRETYGAVVGLVEARISRDADVRKAMRSIAADECRHAELAWAVAAWVLPRLTAEERDAVERAKQQAVASLGRGGNAGIVRMLAERVWREDVACA
jgi:hypothetical protein